MPKSQGCAIFRTRVVRQNVSLKNVEFRMDSPNLVPRAFPKGKALGTRLGLTMLVSLWLRGINRGLNIAAGNE